ncbi:aldo/keto reductase [Acetobacter senegalensis]|nr:aldo/keto reductase [Acetobacter senegalensis]
MKRHQLGTSDLAISTIGLGTWAIAGPGWEFGWGAQDDSDSLATLEYAIDQGVNWIDTAAVYGLGHAEAVVGQLLRRIPPSRRPLVFTKGSLVWDEQSRVITHSLDPASLTREVESSLRRLGTDVIDLTRSTGPLFHPVARMRGWKRLYTLLITSRYPERSGPSGYRTSMSRSWNARWPSRPSPRFSHPIPRSCGMWNRKFCLSVRKRRSALFLILSFSRDC